MKFSALIKSVLASAALWTVADTAMALTCDYKDGIKPADGFMPLQISAITVGRDVPLGSEVYRQTFQVASGQSPTIECKYAPFDMWSEYVLPNSSRANWSSGPYANKVYKTNIDGLGVAFKNSSGLVLPGLGTRRPTNCNSSTPCPIPLYNVTNFELILVKIGDVKPGVLRGGTLPAVQLYFNANTVRGSMLKLQAPSRLFHEPAALRMWWYRWEHIRPRNLLGLTAPAVGRTFPLI